MEPSEMEQKVNYALGPLWATVIEEFTVDITHHTIVLLVAVGDDHQPRAAWERHRLRFEQVASFLYRASVGDELRHISANDNDPDNYSELSEIDYADFVATLSVKNSELEGPGWDDQMVVNFILEIWDATLFIEASVVWIDDQRFEVGYPETSADS
jgi:hypothetical protein